MKRAFGLVEIIIVVVLMIVLYFTCFAGVSKNGRQNPFSDGQDVKSRQELVDEKVRQIEDTKALKQKIEQNLQEGY